ncbi:MAG: hypothetical protein LBQ86_04580, partial [Holophagales bacterium]|nr:hypothetical protein [Holophagales bacterium]
AFREARNAYDAVSVARRDHALAAADHFKIAGRNFEVELELVVRLIESCLAEKSKVSMQRYFPVQNREYGIANTLGAKRGFEPETLYIHFQSS